MGCKSSKTTSNEGSTGGKTLLKAHTTALNGDGAKLACARDVETTWTASDDCAGCTEPAAEPPADTTEEDEAKMYDAVDQDGAQIKEQTEHKHKEACLSQSLVPQTAEAEAEEPCDLVQRTASRTALKAAMESNDVTKLKNAIAQGERAKLPTAELQPAKQFLRDKEEARKADVDKPSEATSHTESRAVQGGSKSASFSPPVLFAKGDLVNIVGPAANGNVEYQGKSGRIVQIDGGNIPYEVVVEQETAWFQQSSLEKPKALKVTVSGNGKNEASCCAGSSGFLGCCTDVKR